MKIEDAVFELKQIRDVYASMRKEYKSCVEALDKAIKALEEHWIPCSERLPEERINPNTQDYDWVLCSTTFNDVRAYHFGRGKFLHGCGDVTQYVVAWMPLPEPYKEDEHEES